MRLIFAGTPEFAQVALAQLHAGGADIALVLTQPDRPAGRGLKLHACAVKQWAQAHHIPVAQPRSLRLDGAYPEDAAAARLALIAAQADAMVVAAYGLILPQWVLELMAGNAGSAGVAPPKWGCLNIHASLLPRWRGAAPIHRAIEAGDLHTGITIMQMDAGLDTGAMLLVEKLPIAEKDTTGTLHDRLAVLGAQMIVQVLKQAETGALTATPQPESGISYAHKIAKAEAQVDWHQSAQTIERRMRAFNPAPGLVSTLEGQPLKLFSAEVASDLPSSDQPCGTILRADPDGLAVQCGEGVLRLTELQRSGGKRLPVADFLRGSTVVLGAQLGGDAP